MPGYRRRASTVDCICDAMARVADLPAGIRLCFQSQNLSYQVLRLVPRWVR
jgi:hypothetical protein